MAAALDRDTIEKAYARWAPVYDLVFGAVFEQGRTASIEAAEQHRSGRRAHPRSRRRHRHLAAELQRAATASSASTSRRRCCAARRSASSSTGCTNVEALAVMDAKHLALPDASFDVVVAQYVITAVPDPEATLDEFVRVLKPGGEIILVNHLGAESGFRRAFEQGFSPIARRLGWSPEFPWARLTRWAERRTASA